MLPIYRRRARLAQSALEGLETRRVLSGSAAVWTGTAGDGLWSDGANWQGGAAPTAGQDVEFDNLTGTGKPQIVQVDEAVEIGSLDADNTILQGSQAITIDGDVTVGLSNYVAIIAPVTLTHTTTLNVTAGSGGTYSDLLLCDPISDGGHGYGLTITGGGEVDVVPCTIQNGDASYLNSDVTETYTGPTVVNDGSVFTVNARLASDVVASGNSQVFGSGSVPTLSESGSEFGATDLYGFYPGVLTVTDGVHFSSGGLFSEQVKGSSPGDGSAATGFSELDVLAGTIELGGATFQGDSNTGNYTPAPGDVITLIKNETGHAVTGTFANLPEGTHLEINSHPFVISYHGGASGRDVTLTVPTTPTIINTTSSRVVMSKTATLSVLGADPNAAAGEAGLTYTWSVATKPAGAKAPTFARNDTNAAKTMAVRVFKAGTYYFQCIATNATGGTATTMVRIVVAQSPKAIRITPHAHRVRLGATLQYTAAVLDQFGHPIRAATTISFTIQSGFGSIDEEGLYTADDENVGHVVIRADGDDVNGTVALTVV